jgi:hypothetical protein
MADEQTSLAAPFNININNTSNSNRNSAWTQFLSFSKRLRKIDLSVTQLQIQVIFVVSFKCRETEKEMFREMDVKTYFLLAETSD